MSKKSERATEFYSKLAQDSGLDKETSAAVLKALENEKFAETLGEGVLRHDEFSSKMDEHRTVQELFKVEQEKLAGEKVGHDKFYQDLLAHDATRQENERLVQAYKDQYGDLNGDGRGTGDPPQFDASQFVSKKDMETKFQELQAGSIALTKQAMRLSAEHLKNFNEVLDPDALEKIAMEKGLPLTAAYQELVSPMIAERSEKDMTKKIEEAREQGRQDAIRDHKIPTDVKPSVPHMVFDQEKPDDDRHAARDAFVEGHQSVTSTP